MLSDLERKDKKTLPLISSPSLYSLARDKVSLDKYPTLYSFPFEVALNISVCFILPKIAIFRVLIHTFFNQSLYIIEIYLIKELCQQRHR